MKVGTRKGHTNQGPLGVTIGTLSGAFEGNNFCPTRRMCTLVPLHMDDRRHTFADVSDEHFDDGATGRLWIVRPLLVAGLYILLFGSVLFEYEGTGKSTVTVLGREFVLLDWVTLLAVCILAVVAVPGLVRHRDRLLASIRRFVEDRFAAATLVVLLTVGGVGVLGPLIVARPAADPLVIYNPPIGFSIPNYVTTTCVGEVAGDSCHGSWKHPLGTDQGGRDVVGLVVYGLQTSLQVGVSAAVIAGGFGSTVGITAGALGGRVESVLMRYVDLQGAIPAFFVYIFVITLVSPDLVLLVVVLGMLSWGGLARLVRSEVYRVREELYIQSARVAGAGPVYRLRHHVLPNVVSGVVIPLTTLVPLFILYEAALSFLGLGESDPRTISVGSEIASGLENLFTNWWDVWWLSVFPAIAVTLLVLSLLVVGDRIGDLLQPETE